ncbi:MAG: hypothetical protein HY400_07355 [Elusimicrobia bacterium]|nr:hypothetical protein [Elusimicrobiota bacterium]
MAALIEVVVGDENKRQELLRVLQGLGYETLPAVNLSESISSLAQNRPRAVLVAEETLETPAEVMLKEIQRAAPLLPVVICLGKRDASRAVEYMKLGAFECVAPPWTEEALRASLRKAVRFDGTALGLSPQGPSRKAILVLGVLIAAAFSFGMGITVWRWHERKRSMEVFEGKDRWDLPYAHPSGITWDGRSFWIGDWFGQAIYRHSPKSFEVQQVYRYPTDIPVALTFAEGTLWTATGSGLIQKHLNDESLRVIGQFKFPGVIGLCYDGLYLWSLNNQRVLMQHLLDDRLTVLQSFYYPGSKPVALACNGQSLWTLDAQGPAILKHDLERPGVVFNRKLLSLYQSEEWRPSGLAWDGMQFWTVAEGALEGSKRKEGGRAKVFRH